MQFERLEARTMFDGDGFGSGQLLANDAYLTLSFAADGVSVAGQSNALAAKFNSLPPQAGFANWQDAILKAFQTWAMITNADIGVVPDGGQPFGSIGAARGDSHFGDIRIAAIAMDPAVGGEAIPVNQLVGGTWQADILFNTNFTYQSLSEVFAIALHEAGHVFGLGHSVDPNSPMYGGTVLTATTPTAADIAELRALYGTRLPDFNEPSGTTNNDSFATATTLSHDDDLVGIVEGSIPLLAYGDITANSDVDFFQIEVPELYSGDIQIDVRSTGISLLAPRLQVYDKQQQLIQELVSTDGSGDILTYTIATPTLDDKYYFAVSGATPDLAGLGGYAVKVTFAGVAQVDTSILDLYGDRNLRKLGREDIHELLVPSNDDFLNDDGHTDDELISAIPLQSESDFVDPSRFETFGSISDTVDHDFYHVRSPQNITNTNNVLTVAVRTLTSGALVPTVRAFDRNLAPLPVTILSNGGGELVVQIAGIESDRNYYIEVAANDPTGPFNTGNYQLTASFRDQAANFTIFKSGTVEPDGTQDVKKLYVAQPQLFHFLLQAGSAAVNSSTAVIASIYNDADTLVYRLAASVGQTQSQNAVLLAPGTYTVKISTLSLQQPVTVPVSYTLSGIAISDPFASDPTDQTTNPFPNPNPPPAYLYPGDLPSNNPFLWTDFLQTQSDPPPDLQTQISLLLGNWWTWVWNDLGANGPPLGQSDGFDMPKDTPLNVAANSGVLSNDFEPEGEPMVAALVSSPRVGSLQFNSDGSFQYSPPVGFNGAVQFTYQVSDFFQLSTPVTVTLAVGMLGDYDHNNTVNQADQDVWRGSFGSTSALDADGNGNGVIDQGDYVVWRRQTVPSSGVSLPGDYDRNSTVNQADHDVWRSNFGSTTVLNADGNGNNAVDASDYIVWRRNLSATAGASLAAAAATPEAAAPATATASIVAPTPLDAPLVTPLIPHVDVNLALLATSSPQLVVASSFSSSEMPLPAGSSASDLDLLSLLASPSTKITTSATDATFSTTASESTQTLAEGGELPLDVLDFALANLWSTM